MPASAYGRYLLAKRTVDDRALNRHVLDRLRAELAQLQGRPVRIIELGAGLGTMVARLLDLGMLVTAEYRLLDVDGQLLDEARAWLARWAEARRLDVLADEPGLRLRGESGVDVAVGFEQTELGEVLDRKVAVGYDLLIASAFLDLIDVPATLPRLLDLLAPQGLYYFALNFDGETIFEPEHPADGTLLDAYHRSMDERIRYGRRAGDSKCGRHLFTHLHAAGAHLLAAGASDWVVHATDGNYPDDEAYFLRQILDTVAAELRQHRDVDRASLEAWLAIRREQVDRGRLAYVAHQLDFLGRCRERPG